MIIVPQVNDQKETTPVQRVTQVDKATGEVMDGVLVYVAPRLRIGGWLMTFQDSLLAIARDANLTLVQHRVLWWLLAKIDWENYIAISQADAGRELNLDPAQVSRAMKALEEAKILFPGPKVGRIKTWRLNPTYGWKGKVKNLQAEKKKHLQLISTGETNAD